MNKGKRIFRHNAVGIYKEDDFTGAFFCPDVSGPGCPSVFIKSYQSAGELTDYINRTVRGGIIYDDDLKTVIF